MPGHLLSPPPTDHDDRYGLDLACMDQSQSHLIIQRCQLISPPIDLVVAAESVLRKINGWGGQSDVKGFSETGQEQHIIVGGDFR